MKKKLIYIFLVLITLIFLTLSLYNTPNKVEKNYFYFDTYINIKLNTSKNTNKLFDEIESTLKEYHTLTDKYNSYDNIINVYYLNEVLDNDKEVTIDSKLSTLINEGIKYYEITNGYINIASSNLIDVWKKYIEEKTSIPSYEELNVNTNIKDISLENNIYKKKNNIKIDLGSYTKGYVTDVISNIIENYGIKDYIIDAGGNIKVGTPSNKETYSVGVIDPINNSNIFDTIHVVNSSVVTSGDYQRYYEYNNVRYNHIINPYTLYPSSIYKSVTVIYPSSFLADIYSTYLFMLDIDSSYEVSSKIDNMKVIWYIDKDNIKYSYK